MRLEFLIVLLIFGLMPGIGLTETITVSITDFRDDAEEEVSGPNAGNVFRTSSDLEFGNQNGVEQLVGLRFQDMAIPAGATINSATIIFTATETDVGTLDIPVLGELSVDAVEFGDLTPISPRPTTISQILWTVDPWFPEDSGANTTTPDISSLVQEIVDQSGWSSGNAMAFIFLNDPLDSSERIAYSYDGNPIKAAKLTVDFTPTNTAVVTPDTVNVTAGNLLSGGVAELAASDDQVLTVNRPNGNIETVFSGFAPNAIPGSLTMKVESNHILRLLGSTRVPVDRTIQLFNYSTNNFETVDIRRSKRVEQVVTLQIQGDLSRFVQTGTGLIQSRMIWVKQGVAGGMKVHLDHVEWTFTY